MEALRQNVEVPDIEEIRDAEFVPRPHLTETFPSVVWLSYFRLLRAKWRPLLKTVILGFAIGTAIAFLIPKRYESTVTVMPPDSLGNNSMMMAALATKASPELAGMAANVLGMKSTGALFLGLLRSRTVEEHIIEQFRLQSVYWVRYRQDARKVLNSRTDLVEDRKSGIITITVRDRDPLRAHDIAQAYVEELNHLVSQVSTSSARRERVFIEQRLSAVKADLEDAEQQFSAFASKNTALDIKEQTKAMVESAALLQGQLIAAQSELEGLVQIYNPNNVRVRSAQARVDELKRQLSKISGTDASLAADATQSNDQYPSIRKLPLLGVQWADLYRRVKIQEAVYELLNQQYELARIQEAKEVPTVNVVDPADLPEKKSWPPRLLIISLLTVLSLAAAVVTIVGSEKVQSLETDDPRRQLAISATEGLMQFRTRVVAHRFFSRTNHSKPSSNGAEQ
jgi:uncharacterized protein involved in exopolysaccharide biosynthesis